MKKETKLEVLRLRVSEHNGRVGIEEYDDELGGGHVATIEEMYSPSSVEVARLFAASPELLMWASDLVERIIHIPLDVDTADTVRMLKTAIAKAEGK